MFPHHIVKPCADRAASFGGRRGRRRHTDKHAVSKVGLRADTSGQHGGPFDVREEHDHDLEGEQDWVVRPFPYLVDDETESRK